MPAIFRHPVYPNQFTIFEPNGTRTYIRDSDSYGLVVEQRLPNGEKRKIKYGNDQAGYELYIAVLRFLIFSRKKIPSYRFKPGLESDHLRSSIASKLRSANLGNGAIEHQMDMSSHGVIVPARLPNGVRGLLFSQNRAAPIFLSPVLLEGLAKIIPQVFAANPYFHQIHAFYTQKSNRKNLRPLHFVEVPPAKAPWMQVRRKPGSQITKAKIMSRYHRRIQAKRRQSS